MSDPGRPDYHKVTQAPPAHLAHWELPPGWGWGSEGVFGEHRHYQEVIDALGRSLSLVSAPDAAHAAWLGAEARAGVPASLAPGGNARRPSPPVRRRRRVRGRPRAARSRISTGVPARH